jgi:catechol 2,3-dioxygenase-like lactoylglutathione lyase family enzyme
MPGVALLKIPVTDIDRAVAFYHEAPGLAATFVAGEYGWAQLDGASVAIALYLPGKGGGNRSPGGSVDFHLTHNRLDEVQATVRRVRRLPPSTTTTTAAAPWNSPTRTAI